MGVAKHRSGTFRTSLLQRYGTRVHRAIYNVSPDGGGAGGSHRGHGREGTEVLTTVSGVLYACLSSLRFVGTSVLCPYLEGFNSSFI